MSKNLCGKTRNKNNPHEVWKGFGPMVGWTWNVLKKYQSPEKETGNKFARHFCFVTSPLCPDGEYGDTYVHEYQQYSTRVDKVEPAPLGGLPASAKHW